jgi:hypothetical protein
VNDIKHPSTSSSGTLVGFPGNGASGSTTVGGNTYTTPGFTGGDTIHELYAPSSSDYYSPFPGVANAAYNDSNCNPTRNITDSNGNPTTTPLLETGVSATVSTVQSNQAHVAADPISLGGGDYDLPIDEFPTDSNGDPTDPFQVGDTVYASPSGAVGTVISETTDHTAFQDGETVVDGSTGGSAVIQSGSITGYSFIVDGSITGTIAAGDTITGQTSGAKATVAKVETGYALLAPQIHLGSVSFAATTLQYTNELDFCQAIRNAIAVTEQASAFGSSNGVYTVNQDQGGILVNPAYLLVSGGVEDANGNGVDGSFDQRNEITTLLDFESPARLRNDSQVSTLAYDDVVSTMQMKVLAERLKCARNIGATVERNLEEMAFERNEQALTNVQFTYAALQLANWDVAIKAVEVATSIVEAAITLYKSTDEDPAEWTAGLALAAEIVEALASIPVAIAELAVADQAQQSAQSDYAGACTAQDDGSGNGTGPDLTNAVDAANTALDLAVRADAWGGVQ